MVSAVTVSLCYDGNVKSNQHKCDGAVSRSAPSLIDSERLFSAAVCLSRAFIVVQVGDTRSCRSIKVLGDEGVMAVFHLRLQFGCEGRVMDCVMQGSQQNI